MTLPASGTIAISDLKTEFGGTDPASMNQYYRGGSLVPNTTTNSNVPTSGTIGLTNFYNASGTVHGYIGLISGGSFTSSNNAAPMVTDSSNNSYLLYGAPPYLLLKTNVSGTLQYQNTLSYSSGFGGLVTLNIDSSNNLYTGGSAYVSPYFSPCVSKFSSTPSNTWSYYLIDASNSQTFRANVLTTTLDSSGNIYISGTSQSNTNPLLSNKSYITKLNTSGFPVTAFTYVGNGSSPYVFGAIKQIQVDSSGNYYAAFPGSIVLSATSYEKAAVVKFNSSGTQTWAKWFQTGSSTTDKSVGLAIDESGNTFLLASMSGEATVIKLDSSGNIVWSKYVSGGSTPISIKYSNSYIYFTVNTSTNILIIKLDQSGNVIWQRTLSSTVSVKLADGVTGLTVTPDSSYFSFPLWIPNVGMFTALTDGTGTGSYTINSVTYTYAASGATIPFSSLSVTDGGISTTAVSFTNASATALSIGSNGGTYTKQQF